MASRTTLSATAVAWRALKTSGGIWFRLWKLWADMAEGSAPQDSPVQSLSSSLHEQSSHQAF